MKTPLSLKHGYASAVVGRTCTYKVFVFRLFRDVSVNSEINKGKKSIYIYIQRENCSAIGIQNKQLFKLNYDCLQISGIQSFNGYSNSLAKSESQTIAGDHPGHVRSTENNENCLKRISLGSVPSVHEQSEYLHCMKDVLIKALKGISKTNVKTEFNIYV